MLTPVSRHNETSLARSLRSRRLELIGKTTTLLYFLTGAGTRAKTKPGYWLRPLFTPPIPGNLSPRPPPKEKISWIVIVNRVSVSAHSSK